MANISYNDGCNFENPDNIIVTNGSTDCKRTTLSLSLSVSDKKALKMMAAERNTTIAAIIHEWIADHVNGGR